MPSPMFLNNSPNLEVKIKRLESPLLIIWLEKSGVTSFKLVIRPQYLKQLSDSQISTEKDMVYSWRRNIELYNTSVYHGNFRQYWQPCYQLNRQPVFCTTCTNASATSSSGSYSDFRYGQSEMGWKIKE